MTSPHVYDKSTCHLPSVREHGLSEEHAANQTVMFLRWLIEHGMMSESFERDAAVVLGRFRAGSISIHKLYGECDWCLVDDMLSEEGNAFARHYFDFEHGRYIRDYAATLHGQLPSEFHIDYNEENYHKMRKVIDRRYQQWKKPKRKWWPF